MRCGLTLVDHGLDVRMLEQDLEIVNLEAVLKGECVSARLPDILLLFHIQDAADSLGHSNGFDESFLLELFHLFPSSTNISITKSGRVNEVEVDVV